MSIQTPMFVSRDERATGAKKAIVSPFDPSDKTSPNCIQFLSIADEKEGEKFQQNVIDALEKGVLARSQSVPKRPGIEALQAHYSHDAHFWVTQFPSHRTGVRLNKELLTDLKKQGSQEWPALTWIVIDPDNPGHEPWPWAMDSDEAQQQLAADLAILAKDPVTATAGVYHTRGGRRVLWPLATPLEVRPDTEHEVEARIRALSKYVAEVTGWEYDSNCTNWGRCFRLPFVKRDGVDQRWPADFSRMAPVDLNDFEPAYEPGESPEEIAERELAQEAAAAAARERRAMAQERARQFGVAQAPAPGSPGDPDQQAALRSAQRYTDAIPGEPKGSRHQTGLSLTKKLIIGFALSLQDAIAIAHTWGDRCTPPVDSDEMRKMAEGATQKIGIIGELGSALAPRLTPQEISQYHAEQADRRAAADYEEAVAAAIAAGETPPPRHVVDPRPCRLIPKGKRFRAIPYYATPEQQREALRAIPPAGPPAILAAIPEDKQHQHRPEQSINNCPTCAKRIGDALIRGANEELTKWKNGGYSPFTISQLEAAIKRGSDLGMCGRPGIYGDTIQSNDSGTVCELRRPCGSPLCPKCCARRHLKPALEKYANLLYQNATRVFTVESRQPELDMTAARAAVREHQHRLVEWARGRYPFASIQRQGCSYFTDNGMAVVRTSYILFAECVAKAGTDEEQQLAERFHESVARIAQTMPGVDYLDDGSIPQHLPDDALELLLEEWLGHAPEWADDCTTVLYGLAAWSDRKHRISESGSALRALLISNTREPKYRKVGRFIDGERAMHEAHARDGAGVAIAYAALAAALSFFETSACTSGAAHWTLRFGDRECDYAELERLRVRLCAEAQRERERERCQRPSGVEYSLLG